MFERRLPHGAVAFVAATFFGLSGCSSAAKSEDSPASGAPRPSGPSGDSTGATSIAFSEDSVVLIPGQARTLSLTVEPAATYTVRLALVGDAADAYLDASEFVTDDAGKGSFKLTAPSSPKTFSVRASVGALSTEIQATPAPGYTTVEVVPVYSGHRKITDWVGTVSIGSSCDATIVPPPDGPLSATAPDRPRIGDVPLGTPLTVTIRAGHFAGGCVELSRVVSDGAYTVSVPVQDRPLALDGVSVPLVLGVDTTQGWSSVWKDLATSVQNAFCPPLETDVSALLDAMHDSTPTVSQGEFTAARTLHAWDEKLLLSLDSAVAKHGLDDAVNRWISDGLKMLSDSPLVGRLSTNSSAAPTLTFSNVGGFLPKDIGFPAALTDGVSLTASADDHVVFGATTPSFQPAKIAAALSLSSARTEFPDAKSIPDALATLVGCANVGTILAGAGSIGYGTCGASCLAQRCEDALAAMWANASTAGDTATLEISGSAAVTSLGDVATPLSLDGTWVGTMQVGTSSTHVGGAVASALAAAP